ncbi:MAG: sodium:solute symporter family protein [Bacteroidota bacterium]
MHLLLDTLQLQPLDWGIIAAFFIVSLAIGAWVSRQAGSSAAEFFLSGRNMPWWLLGISMVATTFSADTPNLVTDIVRQNGVSGNWAWWAFLLTGMLTVFVYAKLWRRSGVLTDLEFYELRYSGKPAAFVRGFRAIYLGVFFNVIIMATVCLAAIKIGGAMLGLDPWITIVLVAGVTVIYSSLGGLRGVLFTDFFQFILAMIGSIWATFVIIDLPEVESLNRLLSHPEVNPLLNILPDFNDTSQLIPLLILPLAVQWWSVWYPGAEPGGGGYIAQRMLSAKSETHAIGATLLFNASHYALRPWPWILIALASVVLFPMKISPDTNDTISISADAKAFLIENVRAQHFSLLEQGIAEAAAREKNADRSGDYQRLAQLVDQHQNHPEIQSLAYLFFEKNHKEGKIEQWTNPLDEEKLVHLHLANPQVGIDKIGQDIAYPTMLRRLPVGLIGLVLASLIAAVMSTISTHLNWGSSYVVNDFYQRFVKPNAKDKELVAVGRISTVVLMLFSALLALFLSNALQAFNILLQIGAGTGLIFILRWFWWRINAWSEISAMVVSFGIALFFEFSGVALAGHWKLVIGVAITTIAWVLVTLITQPTDDQTLRSFYRRIKPAGNGWDAVLEKARSEGEDIEKSNGRLSLEILAMVVGSFTIYGALFATGFWIYGNQIPAIVLTIVAVVGAVMLFRIWNRIKS